MKLISIVAQATTAPAQGEELLRSPLIPIILLVVIMYFFMFRTKSKEQKKRTDMLSQLKKGDEVQTIGGAIGRVMEARPDRVLLKVDESSNTKIWFTRSAIHRVVTEEKAEAK